MAKKGKELPLLDEFLLSLSSNNYSPETVYNYERDLAVFGQFLRETKVTFRKLDKRDLEEYKAYLCSQDRVTPKGEVKAKERLSAYSINRMLSAVRMYLRYLAEMDHKVPVSWDALKLIKTGKKHPRVAELEDLVRLVEAPSYLENNRKGAARNRAALETLFATGMRISELLSLNRDDIDESGRIFIKGKGKKERFVYLTPRARKYLSEYLSLRRDGAAALFVPFSGKNVTKPSRRLSANYLQARIKFYRQKLKINIPTSAHSLRHGFATYLAEKGASPAAIQILLGHESLDTTTRYVHASDRFAEETHKKFHPLPKPS